MKLHAAVVALTPPPFEAAGLQRAFVLSQFISEVVASEMDDRSLEARISSHIP